jgi:acetyltransferase-like isoleucine patch superfamily enzyme
MRSRLRRALTVYARDIWLNTIVSSTLVPRFVRWRLLQLSGLKVYKAAISAGCFIGSTNVSIGPGTFINYGCFLDAAAPIAIGRDCQIGMRVLFCTGTHEIGPATARGGEPVAKPIVVEDGCWLGAGTTVLPGVTVERGCVVAAGSVLTTNCQPHSLYAGVPARLIRKLD